MNGNQQKIFLEDVHVFCPTFDPIVTFCPQFCHKRAIEK
uniref:Uncharacterized protein n=1 Tax=Anguilla anguilla TaxID=7936 RepID=A0A0E9UEC9_ANGAN